jgi:hypothetical protein
MLVSNSDMSGIGKTLVIGSLNETSRTQSDISAGGNSSNQRGTHAGYSPAGDQNKDSESEKLWDEAHLQENFETDDEDDEIFVEVTKSSEIEACLPYEDENPHNTVNLIQDEDLVPLFSSSEDEQDFPKKLIHH